MKVSSPYAYNLPGRVPLPKGESEVGELPAAAKKYLDGLIKAGVVTVLSEPKPQPKAATAVMPGATHAITIGQGGAGGVAPHVDGRVVADATPATPSATLDDDAKKRTKKKE